MLVSFFANFVLIVVFSFWRFFGNCRIHASRSYRLLSQILQSIEKSYFLFDFNSLFPFSCFLVTPQNQICFLRALTFRIHSPVLRGFHFFIIFNFYFLRFKITTTTFEHKICSSGLSQKPRRRKSSSGSSNSTMTGLNSLPKAECCSTSYASPSSNITELNSKQVNLVHYLRIKSVSIDLIDFIETDLIWIGL